MNDWPEATTSIICHLVHIFHLRKNRKQKCQVNVKIITYLKRVLEKLDLVEVDNISKAKIANQER